MDDNFYLRFEDKYRGSRKLIKDRLKEYLPIIQPLIKLYPDSLAIDLGCGRGEWLEIIQEIQWNEIGVDTNTAMVNHCLENDLNAIEADAVDFIKKFESNSAGLITGFHIIEHLPFQDQQVLFKEALRALQPGGLLILETPNPENIKVATEEFYLDPTHIHPIPPKFLSFLAEDAGFYRNKIIRLQENKDLITAPIIGLMNVLNGVSPDYAMIAQKEAPKEIISDFDREFEKEQGVSQEKLTLKYDDRFDSINTEVDNLSSKINSIGSENQRLKEILDIAHESIELLQNDKKILINEKDRLREVLIQNQESIKELNKKFEQKDEKIKALDSDLASKDNQIRILQAEINKKSDAINSLSAELAEIKGSKSWKLAMFFRRVRSMLAPPESPQAKLLRKIKNSLDPAITKFRRRRHYRKYKNLVAESGLFQMEWYLSQYPDVTEAGINPLKHYMVHGGFEGRDPGPKFSSSNYLDYYKDVRESGLNPLTHYLVFGTSENRIILKNQTKKEIEDKFNKSYFISNNVSDEEKFIINDMIFPIGKRGINTDQKTPLELFVRRENNL